MKFILSVALALVMLHLQAQSLEYNLDTAVWTVIRTPVDTVWHVDNLTRSYQTLRVQKDASSGYINLVSQTNPSVVLRDADQNKNVELLSNFNGSGAVKIYHHDASGVELGKIELISNYAQSNDSRIITDEVEIRGGSDLAELFEITGDQKEVQPGMLVSLDPKEDGKLRLTRHSYDRSIAGVVSGANGVKPGILMGQDGTLATGSELVTITGRTYVLCNTDNGPIKIGDLLTSSPIPGTGMKASRKRKSRGTIIGKAMSTLVGDKGYVLVLVSLQ